MLLVVITVNFEAREPSNPAVVSEIDGAVTYGGIKRGNFEIFIESKDGVKKKRYMVPLSTYWYRITTCKSRLSIIRWCHHTLTFPSY